MRSCASKPFKREIRSVFAVLFFCAPFFGATLGAGEKQTIKAVYIPLADHYPGIVAYETCLDKMVKADYQVERMKSGHGERAGRR